jgi:predicted Rossmann-fold nucleotide-binding protein
VQQVANLLLEESAIKTLVLTRAEAALAVVTGTSTGAMKAFRIALAATGVGLLVIGLIALVENFDKVKRALENSIPGFKTVSNAIGDVVDTIKEWVGA